MSESVFTPFNLQIASAAVILLLAIIGVLGYKPRQVHAEEPSVSPPQPAPRLTAESVKPGPNLNGKVGAKINRAFYALVNDPEDSFDFEQFDLGDKAVLIELDNGAWINWIWEEEGHIGPEFRVSSVDERARLMDGFTQIVEVTRTYKWLKIRNQVLQEVELRKRKLPGGAELLSDMRLHFEKNQVISICGVEEPKRDQLESWSELPFDTDWTMILFDDLSWRKLRKPSVV